MKVPERGGANRRTREKKPDSLPANRYKIFRGENPTSRTGIEPAHSKIGDKIAWPRGRVESDPLSYRPPSLKPLLHDALQSAAKKKTYHFVVRYNSHRVADIAARENRATRFDQSEPGWNRWSEISQDGGPIDSRGVSSVVARASLSKQPG